ncbi:MAG: isoprenyl transferase [Thermodesulfovibrionales bacterium]|nr:isoprenyl transferase [Thermodesulfovibrionales bacterium]
MTDPIPKHVGFIMDGNGRWAKQRGLPRIEGHRRGAERARQLIRDADSLGIKAVTLYTFSMENWHRPKKEVGLLMKLLGGYLKKELETLMEENVRFRAIGETWRLPDYIKDLIRTYEETTAENTGLTLVTAMSYGGRNEIIRAVRKAIESGMAADEVTEESFDALMDTAGVPHPDLIIRTSGEMRMSNFLTWQSAYSELYFTPTLWPDFTKDELARALEEYQHRDRRFGSVEGDEDEK